MDAITSSLDLNNEWLLSGSIDKTIKMWNWSTGELIKSINTDTEVQSLAVIKQGKIFTKYLLLWQLNINLLF